MYLIEIQNVIYFISIHVTKSIIYRRKNESNNI